MSFMFSSGRSTNNSKSATVAVTTRLVPRSPPTPTSSAPTDLDLPPKRLGPLARELERLKERSTGWPAAKLAEAQLPLSRKRSRRAEVVSSCSPLPASETASDVALASDSTLSSLFTEDEDDAGSETDAVPLAKRTKIVRPVAALLDGRVTCCPSASLVRDHPKKYEPCKR